MSRIVLSLDLIRAASKEAGNRSMRGVGRTHWSEDDYNTAVREYHRLVTALDRRDAQARAQEGE